MPCAVCLAPAPHGLCGACRAELPYNGPACRRCARALPLAAECPACQLHPPPFDAGVAALRYAFPADALVRRLKFTGKLHLAGCLGRLLLEAVQAAQPELPEALVPVPLHAARLRQRGFNQALELCLVLQRGLGLPLARHCCVRARATLPQPGLSPAARRANLRGAFVMRRALGYRHVAIVDDVITTTSTVSELARSLRHGGAERIDVWALCRSMPRPGA